MFYFDLHFLEMSSGFDGCISESYKLSKADQRSNAVIVVAAALCRGVLFSPEHGSRRGLHRLGEGGLPWRHPATFEDAASFDRI